MISTRRTAHSAQNWLQMRLAAFWATGALAMLGVCQPCLAAAERAWTRSDILAIADAEAKRLGYETEQMTLSFDLWDRNHVPGDLPGGLISIQHLISNQEELTALRNRLRELQHSWVVVYREPGQVKAEKELYVIIDADSGELVGYFAPIFPPQTFEPPSGR